MSDDVKADAPKKKKGKIGKLLVVVGGAAVLIGAGVGGGLYAANSGLIGGKHDAAVDPDKPQLVPKSEQKHPGEGGEGGGHGGGEAAPAKHEGQPTPEGHGGDRYATNYYPLEKDFTSNLQDSVHFIQVGVAIATPYDDKVIENIKTNDIAIRSAILMTLGDTTEEQVFTSDGKKALQKRLVAAINATLQEKEGFGGVGNVYFTNFVVQ
ncbi:Flagellar protein FliL [Sphingomonas sp. EC-HK361]|uniref:flagellar basal body-associated FliL family protein n=1 Tax=Sphingomonas sp. EC-HK361 TaxID=2038397 RepID=UPI00125AF8FC|nr:flagellar basal body-associated FliL family protein [Sphingomonas sp. EC-HK361]VVT20661.1 Flagellar protein FliL [Sphingomonas sp. EC-HK361]